MKAFSIFLVIFILGAILAFFLRMGKSVDVPPTGGLSTRLQICPTEKIDNQMPGPGGPKPSYYILNGERHEITEFDEAWVAANCTVPTQVVY